MADFLELKGKEEVNFWKIAKNFEVLTGEFDLKISRELKNLVLSDEEKISFTLNGKIDEEKKSHIFGNIKAQLKLQCQRCLDEVLWDCNLDFDYLLSSKEEEEFLDYQILYSPENSNLVAFLEDEILLSLPIVARHDNCALPVNLKEENLRNNPFEQLKFLMNKE